MMMTLLVAASMGAPPVPVVENKDFPAEQQWAALQATVRIKSTNRDFATCSGVVIAVREGAAYVLTAAHGAKNTSEFKMEFYSQSKYPEPFREANTSQIGLVMESATEDISVLKIALGKDELPGVLKLAAIGARPKVYPVTALTIGCSEGAAPTALVTQITAKKIRRKSDIDVAFFWETNTSPVSGRSGGPLIDRTGKIIGICTARTLDQTQRGYYAHLDEIQAALKRNGLDWLVEKIDR